MQEYWSKIQKFLKDNTFGFGILDKNNVKISMIKVVMGGTLGMPDFKSEKNFFFLQDKKLAYQRCRSW